METTGNKDLRVVYEHMAEQGPEGWRNFSSFERNAINAFCRTIVAMKETIKAPANLRVNFDKHGRVSNWNLNGDFS